MIFALALTDLPPKSKANYDMKSDLANGKVSIVAKTPLVIFYRALKVIYFFILFYIHIKK